MIVCVDGTGVYDKAQYQKDMANSFCKQICDQKGFGRSVYFEGPGGAGLTTRGKANEALQIIKDVYKHPRSQDNNPLFLAGYSRGGACVLQIAKWMVEECPGLRVKGMFLFDPVNRDINLNMDGRGTPPNVQTVYVMLRDKSIEWVDYPNDPDRYGRRWMGTCEWRPQSPTQTRIGLDLTIQDASHGAMGGCAWLERSSDRVGELRAAVAMNGALKAEQLGVQLQPKTFPPLTTLPKSQIRTVKLR